jgi:DNA repair exonuclease SbcCD nuclease subunit
VLLVADTHIGFDLPARPRIERRRRGHDFLANFERALQPAMNGLVDVVVHGGDLFFRSKVGAGLVEQAMQPLIDVARLGVPVFIVPGNHERSRIPLHLWATHPLIHIFDRPRTFTCQVSGHSLALSGFPFVRDVRQRFEATFEATGWRRVEADARLLCLHQAVEGARVGPVNFTFRNGPDVIRGSDIPGGFGAVLSGHIHRAQLLDRDLNGRPLAAPVIYPGSVERTSWAERDEVKKYAVLRLGLSGSIEGKFLDADFVALPARAMVDLVIDSMASRTDIRVNLGHRISTIDPNAIVRIHYEGDWTTEVGSALSADSLRKLAPATMNISLARTRF